VRHILGIGELKVSSASGDRIVTHALGSCIGVVLHDPQARVGGMLHAMLPSQALSPEKAERHPGIFLDVGVLRLLEECLAHGADRRRLVMKAAGGANLLESSRDVQDRFEIGRKNIAMLQKLVAANRLHLAAADLGGRQSRTLELDVESGSVVLSLGGDRRSL
jgi:chemotaxis protein CheD